MALSTTRLGNACVFSSVAFACIGGIYFGLFSCGGYRWEMQVYWGISGLLIALSLLISNNFLRTWLRRVAFPLGFAVIFIFFQSAAMPFYPAAPNSFAEYRHNFMLALEYGPCP